MKEVKIIKGTYGHKVNGRVKPVSLGGTVELQDEEAQRLVDLEVAEYVNVFTDNDKLNADNEKEEDEIITTHLDRTQLETMKLEDLKRLATDMGIDVQTLKKAEIIDLVVQVEVQVNAKDITEEPPVDFPPLEAEAPE